MAIARGVRPKAALFMLISNAAAVGCHFSVRRRRRRWRERPLGLPHSALSLLLFCPRLPFSDIKIVITFAC